MKSFEFVIKLYRIHFVKKNQPIRVEECSLLKKIMNATIRFNDTYSRYLNNNALFQNGIDPLDSDPSTHDGSRTYTPPKVPDLDDVTPDLYYPENADGPDPSEEEQRDRNNEEKIQTEEDHDGAQPNRSEQDDDDLESI